LFTGKPLVVTGRYTAAATGSIVIRGKRAGEDFEREIPVHLNSSATANSILSSFWARRKIGDLMSQDWSSLQTGNVKTEVQNEITQLGLSYKLMTQFTSFVAVEDRVVTTNGKSTRVEVPVEMPEGVSYEGITGGGKEALLLTPNAGLTLYEQMGMASKASRFNGAAVMHKMPATNGAPPAGIASGSGGGIGASVGGPMQASPPPPPPQKQELSKPNKRSPLVCQRRCRK
jgi:Ca-activated chloride channel homolog